MGKTSMQELKEDLIDTIQEAKNSLNHIENIEIRNEIYKYVEATLKLIIQEIENDYIVKEKNQIIEARVKKPLDSEYQEAENYYYENFIKYSE